MGIHYYHTSLRKGAIVHMLKKTVLRLFELPHYLLGISRNIVSCSKLYDSSITFASSSTAAKKVAATSSLLSNPNGTDISGAPAVAASKADELFGFQLLINFL